jgi:molecular chaperone HtpG
MVREGNIKISSENMMPIIKKWLYSDKDIFLREIISNASDAITKHKKLVNLGSATAEDKYFINVIVDKENKSIIVEDNGIGMTEEEIEKYITQIAFSGASDFIEKYEKAGGDGIIGHFGLGFYSAYMVSKNIIIETKSFSDSKSVKWESDGNSVYSIDDSTKEGRGTKIIMQLNDGEEEFLDENNIRSLLKKYCGFMPYEIFLNPKGTDEDKSINNTNPLYNKDPKDCSDEEYKKFYSETFMDFSEPLFWIHLKMDYPFNLKGILYFPKQKNKLEVTQGEVKLFCNQVFIADNIKEVIPEFLLLLKGVIDCPDIPLNVSRSFLQNDGQIKKISKHITKKVADKLNTLYKNDFEKYTASYEDIAPFIKFGCIKEEDFYDKVKDILIYKDLNDKYITLKDIAPEENTDIYYVTDKDKQSQYIKMFIENNMNAIILNHYIDTHFISFLEYKDTKHKFKRIDSELDKSLKEDTTESNEDLINIFKENLENKDIQIKSEKFKNSNIPAIINLPEFSRRFKEMSSMYMMDENNFDKDLTLVINSNCEIINKIKAFDSEKQKFAVNQIYYIAMLSYKQLNSADMSKFIENNMTLLNQL